MPIISIPQSVLYEKLGGRISDEEFEELCFAFGLELDEITSELELASREKGVDNVKSGSSELLYKVEIPANRYDLLCAEGLTRALNIFRSKIDIPVYTVTAPSSMVRLFVKPPTQSVRPFVVAAVLRDIELDVAKLASFIDLQEKLHHNLCRKRTLVAIGFHDLDVLQPPFYYDAKPPSEINFIPLNSTTNYTAEQLMELYSTNAHLKPYLSIIRDKPQYPVIMDSTGTVLSMPPIINGEPSRVSLKTRNIFIEATGTDLHKCVVTLDTITTMFSEYCRQQYSIEPVEVVQYDGTRQVYPLLDYRDEIVSIDYVNRLLGTTLSETEMLKLLHRMGLVASQINSPVSTDCPNAKLADNSGLISVHVPPTRHDILHACDIAEDVGIAYGFDNIPEQLPHTYCIAHIQPINKLTELIRNEIAHMGFTEALSYSLCSKDDISTKLGYNFRDVPAVVIANPKTSDFQVVRTTLLPGILHTIANNRRLPIPLKLFEVQDVVYKDSSKDVGARNHRRICVVYYDKKSGFEIIHGVLDRLMQLFEMKPHTSILMGKSMSHVDIEDNKFCGVAYRLNSATDSAYLPSRCIDILLDPCNRVVGRMGVLHPDVLRNFDLTLPCSVLDLDLEVFL